MTPRAHAPRVRLPCLGLMGGCPAPAPVYGSRCGSPGADEPGGGNHRALPGRDPAGTQPDGTRYHGVGSAGGLGLVGPHALLGLLAVVAEADDAVAPALATV